MGVTAAIILGSIAAAGVAGSSVYSANKQASSAKKGIESQERQANAQLEAAKSSEAAASETAKNKLKLRQASQTKTILTSPTGVGTDEDQINAPSLGA